MALFVHFVYFVAGFQYESCLATQDGPLRENNTKTIERPEFDDSAWHGTIISPYQGEVLDENGCFTMRNLTDEGSDGISGVVGQRLEYTFMRAFKEKL